MKFNKLQAAGNDFILIDARSIKGNWSNLARDMCDRHYGVGADGLILVLASDVADFGMRIINSDGSEAEICGNGLRCFARYLYDYKMVSGTLIEVGTLSGIRTVQIFPENGVVNKAKVNMGKPRFKPNEIPVNIDDSTLKRDEVDIISIMDYPITIDGNEMLLSFVSMGNPHAVQFIDIPVNEYPLITVGPMVENHELFPQRINFEIARVIDRKNIEARVWERGAGETLACGSGTCAIAVIARMKGYIDNEVDIMLPGGILSVEWDGLGEVHLTGPVDEVFEGEWKNK
ncbi:MAG: diaminopimelate epimerase [Dehalococcoidia bacterium]